MNALRQVGSGQVFQVVTRNGTPTGKYYTDRVTADGYAERIGGTAVLVAA